MSAELAAVVKVASSKRGRPESEADQVLLVRLMGDEEFVEFFVDEVGESIKLCRCAAIDVRLFPPDAKLSV